MCDNADSGSPILLALDDCLISDSRLFIQNNIDVRSYMNRSQLMIILWHTQNFPYIVTPRDG